MTKEDKELLLKDLCARLPYGVFAETTWAQQLTDVSGTIGTLRAGQIELFEDGDYSEIKPYLRPMSSMTEEERIEFTNLYYKWYDDELFDYIEEGAEFSIWKHKGLSPVIFDWLKSHHFDYRGLIEKGLALEAPAGMYK